MADQEREIFLPQGHEFQSVVGYRDWSRMPSVVARQTNALLDLLHQNALPNLGPARYYLGKYTLEYLKRAEGGSGILYDNKGFLKEGIDLEVREAATHAYVVFGHLPDMVQSPFVPKGFSRRGMLRAPETRDEFLNRIKELKIGLWNVIAGEVAPQATLEAYPPLMRTFGFFKVGGDLPIRLSDSERVIDQIEREKFNDFLGGMNVSL